MFVLQYVQPGLAGLMDGSVSTLAPLFAAAFATHNTWETFLVGMAASVGAGISMGFAEALSDDGSLTGRGTPWLRGTVCGVMTTIGGVGHTLPYLIPDFMDRDRARHHRRGGRAVAISWIRYRYMDTPFLSRRVPGHGRRHARLHCRHLIGSSSLTRVWPSLSRICPIPHLGPLPRPRFLRARRQARARLSQLASAPARCLTAPMCWTALTADLKAQRPDHVAVTGDLVNLSLAGEFAPARTWLETLGAPIQATSASCPAITTPMCGATADIGSCTGSDYMRGDAAQDSRFPFVRRRGPVALVGLSSAVPTGPFLATGISVREQLARLDRSARSAARRGFVSCRADSSSAGEQAAQPLQAPDRRPRLPSGARPTRRRARAARSRSCAFGHLAGRTRASAFRRSACRPPRPPPAPITIPPPTISTVSKDSPAPGAARRSPADFGPIFRPWSSSRAACCMAKPRRRHRPRRANTPRTAVRHNSPPGWSTPRASR